MISYIEKKPSLAEFKKLRDSVSWSLERFSDERIRNSLDTSPFCVCAYKENTLVGMVRISGDKGMYGYIQDTIVLPEYQRQGIGKEMMAKLLENIKDKPGYLLGVCPSKTSVEFYERFGFKNRPEKPNGFLFKEISK